MAVQTTNRYWYPYKATILLIEDMLQFIDAFIRSNPVDPEPFADFYHNFRYRVYLTYLLDGPAFPDEAIVIPTIKSLGATDLVKVRAYPLMFLGVVTEPVLADQYKNTPLDFWAHDVQHVRRQQLETQRYYDTFIKHSRYYTRRSPFDVPTMDDFFDAMQEFVSKTVLPNLRTGKDMSPEEIDLRRMMKMLVFEIFHEKAWPATAWSLERNLLLGYDIFPIETFKVTEEEKQLFAVDEVFHDPTTMSNTINKLRTGFFDDVELPNDKIVTMGSRTYPFIAKGAKEIFDRILHKTPGTFTEEQLIARLQLLAQDNTNAEEFTQRPKEVAVDSGVNPNIGEDLPSELQKVEEDTRLFDYDMYW